MLAKLNLFADDLLCMVHCAINEAAECKHAAHDGAHIGEEVQEGGLLLLDGHLQQRKMECKKPSVLSQTPKTAGAIEHHACIATLLPVVQRHIITRCMQSLLPLEEPVAALLWAH